MQQSSDQAGSRKVPAILIVDDHPLVCSYLTSAIEAAGMTVCGQTGSADEALVLTRRERPDLVIVDISLDGSSGLNLIKRIHRERLSSRVLVLSSHDPSLYARRALEAGALGYVSKQDQPQVIMTAIHELLQGRNHWPEGIGIDGDAATPGAPSVALLSNRELEVFELIGRGLGTSEIANRLCLSVKTIETHREKIKKKLRLSSGNALTREAMQWVIDQG